VLGMEQEVSYRPRLCWGWKREVSYRLRLCWGWKREVSYRLRLCWGWKREVSYRRRLSEVSFKHKLLMILEVEVADGIGSRVCS
jgi:hypothetical protein